MAEQDEQRKVCVKKKWKTALRLFKEKTTPNQEAVGTKESTKDNKSRLKKQKSNSDDSTKTEQTEEIDPVYLAIKQASSLYTKTRKQSASMCVHPDIGSSSELPQADSGVESLSSVRGSDPGFKISDGNNEDRPSGSKSRAPRLDMKMKSLSLDSPDATPYTLSLGKTRAGRGGEPKTASPSQARHLAPPKISSKHSSMDETERSSTSCSPCPSPYASSTQSLPSECYVVTHEYRARFPEDLDLQLADRLILVDTSDPDWWHGYKFADSSQRLGVFPATCVALLHSNERVFQVLQNLSLCHGAKQLRLYRDQVVFANPESEADGMIMARTERSYRVLCPLRYLLCID